MPASVPRRQRRWDVRSRRTADLGIVPSMVSGDRLIMVETICTMMAVIASYHATARCFGDSKELLPGGR